MTLKWTPGRVAHLHIGGKQRGGDGRATTPFGEWHVWWSDVYQSWFASFGGEDWRVTDSAGGKRFAELNYSKRPIFRQQHLPEDRPP